MELVYLWVDKYKNIEKQGFNFSPRFRCEYDEEKNELTINENKDYVSIFPKNINITAIVGENGSGKSNLLEILSDYISDGKLTIKVFYDGAEFLYKTTDYYHRESEGAICWNDSDISIEWPVEGVLLSEKDKTAQSFSAYKKG